MRPMAVSGVERVGTVPHQAACRHNPLPIPATTLAGAVAGLQAMQWSKRPYQGPLWHSACSGTRQGTTGERDYNLLYAPGQLKG